MHIMIVKLRRDGYESGVFDKSKKAVEEGMLIDENRQERELRWEKREGVAAPGIELK